MTIFDVDPKDVNSGWMPLALTVLLGVIIFLLFWSMRRQMRRIDIPEDGVSTGRAEDTSEPSQEKLGR